MKNSTVLVCGGGINGIVNAILLARKGHQVTLVEASNSIGGLYKSIDIDNWRFDQGLYVPQLTGIKAVDDVLLSCCKVQIHEGPEKDIAGNVFQGVLNKGSLFIDGRLLPREIFAKIFLEMVEKISENPLPLSHKIDMETYFLNRFGKIATESVFQQISQNLWRKNLKDLASIALKVVHMPRMVFFGAEVSSLLKNMNKYFDDRIAFPDQLKIPGQFLLGKTPSVYPVEYGLHHFLSGLLTIMKELEIVIHTSAQIKSVTLEDSRIKAATLASAGKTETLTTDAFVWCGPTDELHNLLGHTKSPVPDAPIFHRTSFVISKKKPDAGRLFWSWDFDDNEMVRVSYPWNYCPQLAESGQYPILLEYHDSDQWSEPQRKEKIISYLERVKITNRNDVSNVYSPDACKRKFFVPSVANINRDQSIVRDIEKQSISNLYFCSAKISLGIFYLHDLLTDGYQRLTNLLDAP